MRTINLKSNGLGRYDDVSPFMITGNKLEITVTVPQVNGDYYFIAENNGKSYKIPLYTNGAVTLNELTAGELTAQVDHYYKGVRLKTYRIEPLILCEASSDLSGTPEINNLALKVTNLETAYSVFKKQLISMTTQIKELSEMLAAERARTLSLLKFAWTDYLENVYLNEGGFEVFIAQYGFTNLTDKEITFIKGENEDEKN